MRINRIKIMLSFIFAIIVLLTTACQPTPEREAVVNKGNGELDNKVLEKAVAASVGEKTKEEDVIWSDKRTVNVDGEGDYTVSVNMGAKIPEVPDKVPVYLIEPQEFSIDFMKKAAQYLMEGEIFDGKKSKDDLTKELLNFKKEVSAYKIIDGYQKDIDRYLFDMDKRYNDAADTNNEAKFEYNRAEGIKRLNLKSYPDDNSIMTFSTFMGAEGFLFRIDEFNRSFQYLSYLSGEDIQAKGTKATYKEALEKADEAITTLFEEPFAMVHSDITDKINYQEYLWNEGKETSEAQAYVFYYTREYGGIPSLYIKNAPIYMTEQTEYAKPYTREGMCIVVDDRGIALMKYTSYSDTIEMLNDNVALMPFDDILDRFKDGVFYHNLWGGGGMLVKIDITGVEFGMVREPVKDNPDQYMMVPAWNFIGNIGNVEGNEYGDFEQKSILALNAIDGSIITDYDPMTDPK